MTTWEPIIFWTLFASAMGACAWHAFRAIVPRARLQSPRCPKCRYDMIGAPSLTCPECGHAAKSVVALMLPPRRLRVAVVCVLLIAMLLYAIPVRERVRAHESPTSAFIPTTLRILAIYAEPLNAGWGEHNRQVVASRAVVRLAEPRLFDWQVWLYADALYRRLMREPPEMYWRPVGGDSLLVPLGYLGQSSPAARARLLSLVTSHPNLGVRESAVYQLPRDLPREELATMRRGLVDAMDDNDIHLHVFLDHVAAIPADARGAINDELFERELTHVLRAGAGGRGGLGVYLAEVVRRRAPRTDAMILDSALSKPGTAGYDVRTTLLMFTAQRALRGEPGPLRYTLSGDATQMILKVEVIADMPWLQVDDPELAPVIRIETARANADGSTQWVPITTVQPQPQYVPEHSAFIFTPKLELWYGSTTRCRARVVMGFDPIAVDAGLLPASNYVEFDYIVPSIRP